MKLATKNIKQGFVGLSLHIEDDLEPSKIMKIAHKPKCLCTINVVFESMVESAPLEEVASKKTLPSSFPGAAVTLEWWRCRTHKTQLERREEEEGEANMSRFGGCEPICFKPVIGGSNVLGFAPNFLSCSTLRVL